MVIKFPSNIPNSKASKMLLKKDGKNAEEKYAIRPMLMDKTIPFISF